MKGTTVEDILKKNTDVLKKHHVRRIGIFGSYARGDHDASSDIDILVEFDDGAFGRNYRGYFDTVTSLSADLSALLNNNVDLVTFDMLSPRIAPDVLKEVKIIEEL